MQARSLGQTAGVDSHSDACSVLEAVEESGLTRAAELSRKSNHSPMADHSLLIVPLSVSTSSWH